MTTLFDSNQITLLHFGLKYMPPALVLEYRQNDTMKIRHFTVTFKDRDIKEIETKRLRKKLMKSYPNYFQSKLILKDQLERLINRLKKNCKDFLQEPELGLSPSQVSS